MPQRFSKKQHLKPNRGDSKMGHHRSSNDDRSDSKNPNNPACQAAMNNHGNQLNENNPEFKGKTDNGKAKE